MHDVVIVGAGIAGLTCARVLNEKGVKSIVLEASDGIGGRARSDEVDGFILDRGFQVLLTAYPEAQRLLDYPALHLSEFEPGAVVRLDGSFHRIQDPMRRPLSVLASALAPVGSFADKLKIAKLRNQVTRESLDTIMSSKEVSTAEFLRSFGFSERIIETFFRPFLGGIFLERDLATSSRMFQFVFRMFSQGSAALPAKGMGEIAKQLAVPLPAATIRLRERVAKVETGKVSLALGEHLATRAVVIGTDRPSATRLLPGLRDRPACGTTCFYYAAEQPPVLGAMLALNGEGQGIINNLCVPSEVCSSYAPQGRCLISVSVIGAAPDNCEPQVRTELTAWFGEKVKSWEFLRAYDIPFALPSQAASESGVGKPGGKLGPGIFACGDYLDTASINGAMASGHRTAEAILAELSA